MTDAQILTVALATVPTMITVLIGILINNARMNDLNARMNDLRSSMDERSGDLRAYIDAHFNGIDARFDMVDNAIETRFAAVNDRFNGLDRRLDEMKDMWRAELHRVEEVLDARLKHLEHR